MVMPLEFGVNSNSFLLSIAIPTWNRCASLNASLQVLLPQVNENKELIEVIISDNGSSDSTNEIIDYYIKEFFQIKILKNTQSINVGFYGNFKSCIDLASGKFIWLLSDDDLINSSLISFLITSLKHGNLGAVFLHDWSNTDFYKTIFNLQYVNKESFFKIGAYRLSLISSVVFRNTVDFKVISTDLKENSLVGFAYFLNASSNQDNFAIVYGCSLRSKTSNQIRYNALKIFTQDLKQCLQLAYNCYDSIIIDRLANSFVKVLIFEHLKSHKFLGKYDQKFIDLYGSIFYYSKYSQFWKRIFPLLLIPRINLEKNFPSFKMFVLKIKGFCVRIEK